ncbi:hypothetical protein JCM3774_005795, partial [Rhodotorula dairenensis]
TASALATSDASPPPSAVSPSLSTASASPVGSAFASASASAASASAALADFEAHFYPNWFHHITYSFLALFATFVVVCYGTASGEESSSAGSGIPAVVVVVVILPVVLGWILGVLLLRLRRKRLGVEAGAEPMQRQQAAAEEQ